jgi:hypothetical protein
LPQLIHFCCFVGLHPVPITLMYKRKSSDSPGKMLQIVWTVFFQLATSCRW